MLVLMLPIFFGLRYLYPWAQPGEVAANPTLHRNTPMKTRPLTSFARSFFSRFLSGWRLKLRQWSIEQDATPDAAPTRKARALSGPGLVVYGLLGTFPSVDWVLSLERQWYSTMFGVILLIGQILSVHEFSIVLLALFRKEKPISEVADKVQFHHLGNLLLAFVLFWTYVSFGQLLIIYSGRPATRTGVVFASHRGRLENNCGGDCIVSLFRPVFSAAVSGRKMAHPRSGRTGRTAPVMHLVDMYWLVMPTLHPDACR